MEYIYTYGLSFYNSKTSIRNIKEMNRKIKVSWNHMYVHLPLKCDFQVEHKNTLLSSKYFTFNSYLIFILKPKGKTQGGQKR